jgi:hypothetical protein
VLGQLPARSIVRQHLGSIRIAKQADQAGKILPRFREIEGGQIVTTDCLIDGSVGYSSIGFHPVVSPPAPVSRAFPTLLDLLLK